MENKRLLVPIHFYHNTGQIEVTKDYKKLVKEINEQFPSIIYSEEQFELYYYSENDNEKKIIKDENSLNKFIKEYKKSKDKQHILNLIDKKFEKILISDSNIAQTIYKSDINLKNNDSISKINSSIQELESQFISNVSKIFEKVSDVQENNINNQLQDQLTISFMKTPIISQIIDIENYLYCTLCSQMIYTNGYYKCLSCNFNTCKDCYFRFQNQNFHSHELIYAIQNKENNILLSQNKSSTNKIDYKYEEILDFISKTKSNFEEEKLYSCEIIEKNDEINVKYEDNKKENIIQSSITYKNIGKREWKDNVIFRKVLEKDNWFKNGRNMIFEWSVSKKPHVNPNETVTINFKINVAGKSPGDYFCVLGLKRGENYIIRGSICVFKIHINLIADDYS